MVEPITQEQFKLSFTPIRGEEGSPLGRIQRQCVETRWYRCTENDRIGLIIFDSSDNTFQAVTLEDYGDGCGYGTHEVRIDFVSEREAIDVLMTLFYCETGETRKLLVGRNQNLVKRTGRSLAELLLTVPSHPPLEEP